MSSPPELCDLAVDLARDAGKLLMAELPLGRWQGDVDSKLGRELVSHVDRAAEALLLGRIAEAHPDHAVWGEEGGQQGDDAAPYRWIVDPLDGTTNFLHGHPMFAVSIAVERAADDERPAEIVAAAVHLPYFAETHFAELGGGAFMNSRSIRLQVSNTASLDDALIATGFAYDRERHPNYENFLRFAKASRGIRRCGAAAADLAFVAAGRYDAFWELGLRPWDVAAGSLLVREAGGVVCDFSGGDDWLTGGRLIASNGKLADTVQQLLDPAPSS